MTLISTRPWRPRAVNNMRIVKLKAENIKKLVAIEITPKGDVVKISGKNGAGKSSVLDAIMYALGGKDVIDPKPVRNGQEKGLVQLDLGDMIVERRFTAGGENSTLTVTNKEGAKFGSPQAVLDKLIGRLAFDPMDFMQMEPKKQNETLRELIGLDFTEMDAERKQAFDERTDHTRRFKDMRAQREAVKFDPAGAKEEVSSADLLAEYNEAKDQSDKVTKAKQALADAEKTISELEVKLAHLRSNLPAMKEAAGQITPSLEALSNQMATLDERNKNARAFKQAQALDQQLADVEKKGKACSEKIDGIDKDKADLIAASSMPVQGLSFGEGEVLYNGLPLNQASTAEQLRVSIAMAMAMNPKLRVIRITDGSLLDSTSMKLIEEMAAKNDYQCWMEVVDESGSVGVCIEDGAVKQH